MRLFVACEFPNEWLEALAAQQALLRDRLGADGAAVRWVRPEASHLTLHFLGEVPAAEAPRLRAALDAAAAGVRPFELRLGRCGSFGGREPRVLWAGLDGELAALARLQRRIVEAIGANHRAEQHFSPHITLGRIVRRRSRGAGRLPSLTLERLRAALDLTPAASVAPFKVDVVSLMESVLGAGGAVYRRRHQANLEMN